MVHFLFQHFALGDLYIMRYNMLNVKRGLSRVYYLLGVAVMGQPFSRYYSDKIHKNVYILNNFQIQKKELVSICDRMVTVVKR